MKNLFLVLAFFIAVNAATAQDSSMVSMLDDNPTIEKITGAFKSTRVINAHSVEMLHKGDLDFRIMHRFGVMSNGIEDLFGLDNASMRMSFDYGISDNFMIGLGRSTVLKDLDLFVKARIIQQSKGTKNNPLSLLVAAGYIVTTQKSFATPKPTFGDRSSYYIQLIAGRKFNSKFSMQLSPILVHNNMAYSPADDKTIFGLGGGLRYKVSKRIALTADYHAALGKLDNVFTNPLSLGIDIETGGHVFQLHFSNATGMNEKGYLTQTTGDFFKGDMRFGFNLSRIFTIGKKNKKAKDW
jgi:Membrane bound beta barrel domain (DUF5777)